MNVKSLNNVSFGTGYIASKDAANVLRQTSFARQEKVIKALKEADNSEFYDLCYGSNDRLYIIDKEKKYTYRADSSYRLYSNSVMSIKPFNSNNVVNIPLLRDGYENLRQLDGKNDVEAAFTMFKAFEAAKVYAKTLNSEIDAHIQK